MGMGDLRLERQHAIRRDRLTQLRRNFAAWRGGVPYIDLALTRYRCETDTSWLGDRSRGVLGRKDRTSYINYAGRIVSKVNQYVFSQGVEREGIGEEFRDDSTASGLGIDRLMEDACSVLTCAGWCWLHADRPGSLADPETGAPLARSVLDRERLGDRVYWQLWQPDEVVDWHIDATGRLRWLITEQAIYDNSDVMTDPKENRLRTIWQEGGGVRIWFDSDKVLREEPFTISAKRVPFVLVGLPSVHPWWFDDVERIQAGLLNLESSHLESLFEAVFPQLVVPSDLPDNIMTRMNVDGEQGLRMALEFVRGLSGPIMESVEAKGLTRYIMPDQANLKALPEEILRRRRELFEVVGLAMGNRDTAQVQSADSKAWDHLDPAAVMRARAQRMEEAERKMVALSLELDPTFKAYEARYPRSFSMISFVEDIASLTELDQSVTAPALRRELERVKALLVTQRFGVTPDRLKEIMDEIDQPGAFEFRAPVVPAEEPDEDED